MKREIKIIYYMLSIFLVTSCQIGSKEEGKESVSNKGNKNEIKIIDFPKYNSVVELFNASSDYSEEAKTLKVISSEPLHIQISKEIVDGDSDELIKELVKRDIVNVSFQAFAKTNIEKIKITSIPLKLKSDFIFDKYLDKYKKTVTITRENADNVLKKYLNTADYKILFQLFQGQVYVPSNSFEKLKGSELNEVYLDLTK